MSEIGGIKLDGPFLSAPLAGVTDSVMRGLNRAMGAGLVYSEMISGKGLIYNNKNTEELLKITEEEKPVAYQIFGSDAEIMAETAERLNYGENAILDINMGCPVPKIVKNGDGSALLKTPRKIYDIVSAVVEASTKPVTVKIRTGWNDRSKNCLEVAKIIENAGASAITVHGRTREQYYSGKADWQAIKEIKETVKIPVIGNGDVFSGEDARKMMEFTGCDMVMIGRGMLGNPWIFRQCLELYNREYDGGRTSQYPREVSLQEKAAMMKKHLQLSVEAKGEARAVKEMRKHIAWYTKGMKDSSIFRNQLNQMEKSQDVLDKIDEFVRHLEN